MTLSKVTYRNINVDLIHFSPQLSSEPQSLSTRIERNSIKHILIRDDILRQWLIVAINHTFNIASVRVNSDDIAGEPYIRLLLSTNPLDFVEIINKRTIHRHVQSPEHLKIVRTQHTQSGCSIAHTNLTMRASERQLPTSTTVAPQVEQLERG